MVRKKPQSKRQPLRQKYKVQKKVREHTRKMRKEGKAKTRARNALSNAAKLSKDPGIPNLHPLKEQLLEKVVQKRERMKEEAERQKEKRRQDQASKRQQRLKELDQLRRAAEERHDEFDQKTELFEAARAARGQADQATSASSMKAQQPVSSTQYFREFRKLTDNSDVVLCVLDARDPLACRSPDIERAIMAKDPNKRIVYILNKIDLVPKDAVVAWLAYLRHLFPTVAFKSATHDQKSHLGQSSVDPLDASAKQLRSKDSIGASSLVQLLKNYARSQNNKKKVITVGVIGFPNVGKSSLINSLKRTKAVGVGATPGFTKKTQEIYLDKTIRLMDCPGVVFPSSNQTMGTLALQNVVKIEQMDDPVEPVKLILERVKKANLLQTYAIADFSNVQEFLVLVAGKRGKLLQGGVPDVESAARTVLKDWISGKITYVALPPSTMPAQVVSAQIVSSWASEFRVDQVAASESLQLDQMTSDVRMTDDLLVQPTTSVADQVSSQYYSGPPGPDDGADDMVADFDDGPSSGDLHESVGEAFLDPHVRSSDKSTKKKKKRNRRNDLSEPDQNSAAAAAVVTDQAYDFLTDFVADDEMGESNDDGESYDDEDDDDEIDILN